MLTASRRTPDWIDDTFQHFSSISMIPIQFSQSSLCTLTSPILFIPRYSNCRDLWPAGVIPAKSRNGDWFDQLLTRLLDQTALTHVTLLQGTKAYGASVQPMRVPAREDQPRVEHPNFYWLQEDRLKKARRPRASHSPS